MTHDTPVKGSTLVPEGCRTGRAERRPRVVVLVILLLGLVVSEYLLLVNDVPVTVISASLGTVLLAVNIADRLALLPVPRRP